MLTLPPCRRLPPYGQILANTVSIKKYIIFTTRKFIFTPFGVIYSGSLTTAMKYYLNKGMSKK